MAKKPYHHGDLKKALIKGALEILDEDSKLSLRTVSARVGVSHNAAYRHFDDLDDLLGEVAAVTFTELGDALRAALIEEDSIEANLRRGMAAYIDYAMTYSRRYGLVFSQKVPIFEHPSARGAAEQAFGIVVALAHMANAPRPAHTAFLMLTLTHGTIELLKRDVLPAELHDAKDLLVQQAIDEAVRMVCGPGEHGAA